MNSVHPLEDEESNTDVEKSEEEEESEEQMTDDRESSDGTDDNQDDEEFWRLLLEQTVQDIITSAEQDGSDVETLLEAESIDELLKEPKLSLLIDQLRKTYQKITMIYDYSISDKLMDKIQSKQEKLLETFDSDGRYDESINETSWDRFKSIIKQKIADSQEELDPLIVEGDEMDELSGDEANDEAMTAQVSDVDEDEDNMDESDNESDSE